MRPFEAYITLGESYTFGVGAELFRENMIIAAAVDAITPIISGPFY